MTSKEETIIQFIGSDNYSKFARFHKFSLHFLYSRKNERMEGEEMTEDKNN